MAWELLKSNYMDCSYEGNKKYIPINNDDGTVSFNDITIYTNREQSFIGAKDVNATNQAINHIMTALENKTDLYTNFLNYFNNQKIKFETKANGEYTTFKQIQENLFNSWFTNLQNQLDTNQATHLQNQINAHTNQITSIQNNVSQGFSAVRSDIQNNSSEIDNVKSTYQKKSIMFNVTVTPSMFNTTNFYTINNSNIKIDTIQEVVAPKIINGTPLELANYEQFVTCGIKDGGQGIGWMKLYFTEKPTSNLTFTIICRN